MNPGDGALGAEHHNALLIGSGIRRLESDKAAGRLLRVMVAPSLTGNLYLPTIPIPKDNFSAAAIYGYTIAIP